MNSAIKRIIIEISGVSILVTTESYEIINYILNFTSIMEIEDFRVLTSKKNKKCDAYLIIKHSELQKTCNFSNNVMTLVGDCNKLINSSTIRSLIFVLADKIRQYNNMFTLHAAAVEKEGKGIVLMGSSGSGKSTMALTLCLKNDFKLISNEYTLIRNAGKLLITGIYSKLNIRRTTLDNIDKCLGEQYFLDGKKQIFFDKKKINPIQLDISTSKGVEVEAKLFVFISVANEEGTCYQIEDKYWISKYLYGDISKFITANEMPLFYNDSTIQIFYKSLDDEEVFDKRLRFINKVINERKFYMVRGTRQYCAKQIIELYSE